MLKFDKSKQHQVARGMDVAEVDSDMLTDRAYEALRDAIVSLRLPPGQKLHLGQLAAKMKLSDMPIRQALMRLAGEGFVRSYPHRGFYVARPTEEQLQEIFDLRLMCELQAAEWIQKGPLPDGFVTRLAALQTEYERLVEERAEPRTVLVKDFEFHCLVVDQAGRPTLSRWYRGLNVHAQVARLAAEEHVVVPRDAPGTIAGHRRLVKAFAEGSREAVRQAIEDHVMFGRKNFHAASNVANPSV